MRHDFKNIEEKWQKKWENEGIFHAEDNSDKKKFFALVEFPYPSGAGMHVGHVKAYSGLRSSQEREEWKDITSFFLLDLTLSDFLQKTMQ